MLNTTGSVTVYVKNMIKKDHKRPHNYRHPVGMASGAGQCD